MAWRVVTQGTLRIPNHSLVRSKCNSGHELAPRPARKEALLPIFQPPTRSSTTCCLTRQRSWSVFRSGANRLLTRKRAASILLACGNCCREHRARRL